MQGPAKVIDLLSERFPDHGFFEEELGIWVCGPTFPWQTGLFQRYARWSNGDVKPHPWTLLAIDPETTMVPRRRVITPESLQPFLHESQQTVVDDGYVQMNANAEDDTDMRSVSEHGWATHADAEHYRISSIDTGYHSVSNDSQAVV